MDYSRLIRELCQSRVESGGLHHADAHALFASLLDGGAPDLELGAILLAFSVMPATGGEVLGFARATHERTRPLEPPGTGARPVVLASYGALRDRFNLVPLLALLLARMGVPALVHGTLDGSGRISTAAVFRELGVLPCASAAQAQAALHHSRLAFVPTGVLSPGLANLLALRGRLGVRNVSYLIARLLEPFGGTGLRVTGATLAVHFERIREHILACGERAVVLRATAGEPFADPQQRPSIELIEDGVATQLFGEEPRHAADDVAAPADAGVRATAAYIRGLLEGEHGVPLPLSNQLACCLYASGYAADFNQAKAIVAVETRGLAAV